MEAIGTALVVISFWIATLVASCWFELRKIRKLLSSQRSIDKSHASEDKQYVTPKW